MMDNKQQMPHRRIWLKLVLALSLGLNLLVIGAVAGAAWRHLGAGPSVAERGGPPGPGMRAARGPGAGGAPPGFVLLRALERSDRHAVLRAAQQAQVTRASAAAPAVAQAELITALRRAELAPGALDQVIAQHRSDASARLDTLLASWRAQIEAMPLEARIAYAERLEETGKRWGGKGKPPRE